VAVFRTIGKRLYKNRAKIAVTGLIPKNGSGTSNASKASDGIVRITPIVARMKSPIGPGRLARMPGNNRQQQRSPDQFQMLPCPAPDFSGQLPGHVFWFFAEVEEKTRNGILCTPSVNPPRKQRMSFKQRSVTYVKSFLRAFKGTREIRVILYAKDDSFCATAPAGELSIEDVLAVEHDVIPLDGADVF
jgi:hypothetical protein